MKMEDVFGYALRKTIGTKLFEKLYPRGLSNILSTSKRENKAFPPYPLHAMLCHCLSYLYKTTNTPTLNGGEREGV